MTTVRMNRIAIKLSYDLDLHSRVEDNAVSTLCLTVILNRAIFITFCPNRRSGQMSRQSVDLCRDYTHLPQILSDSLSRLMTDCH